MKIKRKGSARWQGGFKEGSGTLSTQSTALASYPYGLASRFDDKPGSNPEELIGAAHSGCFTMALSLVLSEAGLTATALETSAEVILESVENGFAITSVHLELKAAIPEVTDEQFQALALAAKLNCPVSKLFNSEITLNATLLADA
jgi:osmotically inducible protein OsmC